MKDTPSYGQLIVVAVSNELAYQDGWLCYCNSVKLDGRTKAGREGMTRTLPFYMGKYVDKCDGCGLPKTAAVPPPDGALVTVPV